MHVRFFVPPNDSAKEPVRFHAHMTIILFIFDLLDAILMCMSRTTMDNPYLCDFQGIAITTLEVGGYAGDRGSRWMET